MRILTYPDLREQKGIRYSRTHLARLEGAGKWPRRVPYGPGRVGWLETEVDALIKAKADLREERGPASLTAGLPATRHCGVADDQAIECGVRGRGFPSPSAGSPTTGKSNST